MLRRYRPMDTQESPRRPHRFVPDMSAQCTSEQARVRPLSASVVIPTYCRPDDLTRTLRSVVRQTRLPQEVLVIDDGDLPAMPLRPELEAAGVRCILRRKRPPGLTESRNLAIDLSAGDVVLFFDDDVELDADYLDSVMRLYETDHERRIGGVGGTIVNVKPLTRFRRLRRWLDRIFLVSGAREGVVLPSGFCVNYGDTGVLPGADRDVDFLAGAACSYRREVFARERFTPGYRNLAFGEDKDFSYRVSRHWRLVLAHAARLRHFEAEGMRPPPRENGRRYIVGRWLFFRDLVRRHWWDLAFFWYAYAGYLTIRLMIFGTTRRRRDWLRVLGVLDGGAAILLGRLPPPCARTPGVTQS